MLRLLGDYSTAKIVSKNISLVDYKIFDGARQARSNTRYTAPCSHALREEPKCSLHVDQ